MAILYRIFIVRLNGAPFVINRQHWIVAGTTYSGDLLLGSDTGKATGSGVWRIPAANLDAASGNVGRVTQDAAVLFPENAGPNVHWVADGANENRKIGVAGSFDNNGTDHYFAGLTRNIVAPLIKGLAHFNGPQGSQHADRSFVGISVFGLSSFNGIVRLNTDQGLLGVTKDGLAQPANNFSFQSLAQDKREMMEDGSAVSLTDADDKSLGNIFGDDDLSYYAVYGKGIFSRTKKQGKPRD